MAKNLFGIRDLYKVYKTNNDEVVVIKGINLDLLGNRITSIIGRSGSGKTTFLQILGGMLGFDSGSVVFLDKPYELQSNSDLLELRRKHIGFIHQYPSFNLWINLSVQDHFKLIAKNRGISYKQSKSLIVDLMDSVGLAGINLKRGVNTLSSGEKTRLAIALNLIFEPKLLLCDEPTGNLDRSTSDKIMEIFTKLVKERDLSVIIVTHDDKVIEQSNIVYRITDGLISTISGTDIEIDTRRNYRHLLKISKNGTLTIPEDILEQLPSREIVKLQLDDHKVILDFAED